MLVSSYTAARSFWRVIAPQRYGETPAVESGCPLYLCDDIAIVRHNPEAPWRFKATCGHVKYSAKALQPSAHARAFSLRYKA